LPTHKWGQATNLRLLKISKLTLQLPHNTSILACKVLAPELKALGVPADLLHLLDQDLHRCPEQLQKAISLNVEDLESHPGVKQIIVAYGYCGGALEGLKSQKAALVVPLVHDCIPLLLGRTGRASFIDQGNVFFLSPGWIEYGKTPYTEFFESQERFGYEDALWVALEMLKSYREVVLIKTVAGLTSTHRNYAYAMANLFGLAYREIEGNEQLLLDLLSARSCPHICRLKPGEMLTSEHFHKHI